MPRILKSFLYTLTSFATVGILGFSLIAMMVYWPIAFGAIIFIVVFLLVWWAYHTSAWWENDK